MDIISSIGTAITLAQRLREISKNINDAEFKNLLADLYSELAELKLEAAALKEKMAQLKEENRILKSTAPPAEEKPLTCVYGCYKFKDDERLYCTACWDSKRRKSKTTRLNTKFRQCPVCKALLGS